MSERPPIPAVEYSGRYKAQRPAQRPRKSPAKPRATETSTRPQEPQRAVLMGQYDVNPDLLPWSKSAIAAFIAEMQSPEAEAQRQALAARRTRKRSREERDQEIIDAAVRAAEEAAA